MYFLVVTEIEKQHNLLIMNLLCELHNIEKPGYELIFRLIDRAVLTVTTLYCGLLLSIGLIEL